MPPPKGAWNPIQGPGDYDTTATVHDDTYPAIDSAKADLSNKAALVCGGSRGIGKAIVLAFVKAGVSYLAVGARSEMPTIQKEIQDAAISAGKPAPKVLLLQMDTTSEESVVAAKKRVEQEIGRLDVLVNNAGILPEKKLLADSNVDVWWRTFEVNVKGPYLTCHTFLPLLLASEGGLKTIVNVSSVGAHVVMPTLSAYQTSKLALVRMSEFIAKEYAEQGIICVSIHPGNIVTDILGLEGVPDELKHIFAETPELPADTIVWMAAGERKEWLNSRYINVTWDMPELEAGKDNIIKKDLLKPKFIYQ
jgi:NAD(P)-dependent dehydrogenase (short-subunit alcohol dehydrogenase family)